MNSIPTFAADGSRRRNYSLNAIENLLARGLVSVERNSRHEIVSATFCPEADRSSKLCPIRKSIPTGTYYSFEETLDSGYLLWSHRPLLKLSELDQILGEEAEGFEQLEQFLRTTFSAVGLSVARTDQPLSATHAERAALQVSLGDDQERQLRRDWKKPKAKVITMTPAPKPSAPTGRKAAAVVPIRRAA